MFATIGAVASMAVRTSVGVAGVAFRSVAVAAAFRRKSIASSERGSCCTSFMCAFATRP